MNRRRKFKKWAKWLRGLFQGANPDPRDYIGLARPGWIDYSLTIEQARARD